MKAKILADFQIRISVPLKFHFLNDCAFPLNSLKLYQKDFYGFYLLFKAGLYFSIHNNKLQCNSFFCTTNKF